MTIEQLGEMPKDKVVDYILKVGSSKGMEMIRDYGSREIMTPSKAKVLRYWKVATLIEHDRKMDDMIYGKKVSIYILKAKNTDYYKIGVSNNIKNRIKHIQVGCPYQLEEFYSVVARRKKAYKIERKLLNKYSKHSAMGEWIKINSQGSNYLINDLNNIRSQYK